MSLRILIAVTHLLGAGHLTRAAALGRAFAASGHRVTLVSGGMPARLVATDGLDVVQLPPVRATNEDFSALSDPAGRPIGPHDLDVRRVRLLRTLQATRPDVVLTELFPFGRRVLAAEFQALLDAATAMRPRPVIACSLRDILVAPVKPGRVEQAHEIVARYYDAVLVHADPALVLLEESWPPDAATHSRLVYTGYVDSEVPPPVLTQGVEAAVLVSGGSSAAALPLYGTALGAAALMPDRRWHVLVGGGVSPEAFASLRGSAPPNVLVEGARADFRSLLSQAAAFVGLAGYNTVLDVLAARARAVLVPFERGRETEQRLRAERLAGQGLALMLPESELSPEALAEAVGRALASPAPPDAAIDRDGASASVRIVEKLADRRAAPAIQTPTFTPVSGRLVRETLDRFAGSGRTMSLWWRDDDAIAHTAALDRLLGLTRQHRMPLALAAIPARTQPSLVARLADENDVAVLVHGLVHADHAPPGSKKAEFGAHRRLSDMADEAGRARILMRDLFGERTHDVFVPPWNRIAPDLAALLPALGYRGLSSFGPVASTVDGLTIVNTHLDPVAWRGSGSVIDEVGFARMWRRAVAIEDDAPIGLLTHHLVADKAVWSFCEGLLESLVSHPAVIMPHLAKLWIPASTRVRSMI